MHPALLADIVVVVHFLFAGFVVAGFAAILAGWPLGWQWIRNVPFRVSHVGAMGFVGAEAVLGVLCPLTVWEADLRRAAGVAAEEGAFIARWASRLLFYDLPPAFFTTSYVVLTLLALALLYLVPPRRKR